MKNKLSDIRTNLITGFLGVGKTSAVLHLMSQKPEGEKWSVLVNEFGSVGIDGAIYQAQGIAVKEIPGGCMCCAAGVPLQVAVNQVLKATRPQRLLIEPSGLGHPKRVLDTLQGEHFQGVLDLRASLCLIDPRHLLDMRYRLHENFIDQIAMADVLIANKIDLCDDKAKVAFDTFVTELQPPKLAVLKTQHGRIDAKILDRMAVEHYQAQFPHHHEHMGMKSNGLDGYQSLGCQFPAGTVFEFDKLRALFQQWGDVRIKAILHTDKGWRFFNGVGQQLESGEINAAEDNRLEVIVRTTDTGKIGALEEQLLGACRTPGSVAKMTGAL